MHGDGNIEGTTLAQVEIECADCHGTPKRYPWELSLGFQDEHGEKLPNSGRGLAETLPAYMRYATIYRKRGGYLLTARGNPFGNVAKLINKNKAIIHLASGKDSAVPLLKDIAIHNSWKSQAGKVAMDDIGQHINKLECYACHAKWTPQCYGCHVRVNYSKGHMIDWVASGKTHFANGETLESRDYGSKGAAKLLGSVKETRSYLRWENPILGINGEGRVSPMIPGCQVTYTIIDQNGKVIALDEQAVQKDGKFTVSAINMAPADPHTTSLQARTCESCHNTPKTLGYGIQNGAFMKDQGKNLVLGIMNMRTGKIIPKRHTIQIHAIKRSDGKPMNYDWSQIITRSNVQLQTVGNHWRLTGPLPKKLRDRIKRTGICMGCHKNMSNKILWNKFNKVKNDKQHIKLMDELLKKAAKAKLE